MEVRVLPATPNLLEIGLGLTLINDDSTKALKKFQSKCVDIVVTSPPYKNKDGYSNDLMISIFTQVYRIMEDDRPIFVNFGHLKEDKSRPFKVLHLLENIGFILYDTIIWAKPQYKPLAGCNLNNVYEFVFFMSKGAMPGFNKMAIGEPYKDKTNIKRYGKGKDLKAPGNIWEIPYPTVRNSADKPHYDMFPVELPNRCLSLFKDNIPNAVVLDPFCGSGSTGLAAQKLGMSFVGIEINEKHFNTAKKRLNGGLNA